MKARATTLIRELVRTLAQSDRVTKIMYNYQEQLLKRIRDLEDEKANG